MSKVIACFFHAIERRFLETLLVGAQRQAEEALRLPDRQRRAGRNHDAGGIEHVTANSADDTPFGVFTPHVEGSLVRLHLPTEFLQSLNRHIATFLVKTVAEIDMVGRTVQSGDGCDLNRLEDIGVDVGLNLTKSFDGCGIADGEIRYAIRSCCRLWTGVCNSMQTSFAPGTSSMDGAL